MMMDKIAILEEAICKALDGGWRHAYAATFAKYYDAKSEASYPDYGERISLAEIVFDHDFAKALWGHETWYFTEFTEWVPASNPDKSQYLIELEAWQYHLQQMVIAEDPIAYLGANL